jgi:transglutaminase-like putative cysteine protease
VENYLKPTYFIDYDNPIIKNKVSELIKNIENDTERAVKLFYFARDSVKYNPYSPCYNRDDYKSSVILKRRFGYCIQKAILLCSMIRCANIPCKLIFVDIKNYKAPEKLTKLFGDTYYFHGYCQIYLNNKWVSAAPTFNIEMCDKFGYTPTEFNGINDALLHKYNKNNELTFEYVNFHGEFDDLPFDLIMEGFKKELGEATFKKWCKYVDELNNKI